MGFFTELRASRKMALAGDLIDRYLQVEEVVGTIKLKEGTREFAHRLVVSVWAAVPALASGKVVPSEGLLAAAALAYGARMFETHDNSWMAKALSRCLDTLMLYEVFKKMEVDVLVGIDADLYQLATSGYDLDPVPRPPEAEELARIMRGEA